MWDLYNVSSQAAGIRGGAYTNFCCYWRELLPHVIITKPRSDLCWVCQQNSMAIMKSMNRRPEEKSKVANSTKYPHGA